METALEDGAQNAIFNAVYWFAKKRQKQLQDETAGQPEITEDGMDLASVLYRALTGNGPASPNGKPVEVQGEVKLDPVDEGDVEEATAGVEVDVPVNPELPETRFIWDNWIDDFKNSNFYKTLTGDYEKQEPPAEAKMPWDSLIEDFTNSGFYQWLTTPWDGAVDFLRSLIEASNPPASPTTYAENPRPVKDLLKGLGLPKVVEAELEVTADEGSAEEAAEDA